MMLVEARVFRGDDGVLEIGRDLAERDEFVSLVIRRVVNPGLQAALHVHGGGRRIDPARGHKDQRSERPEKGHADEEPSDERPERTFPRWAVGSRGWIFVHTSE